MNWERNAHQSLKFCNIFGTEVVAYTRCIVLSSGRFPSSIPSTYIHASSTIKNNSNPPKFPSSQSIHMSNPGDHTVKCFVLSSRVESKFSVFDIRSKTSFFRYLLGKEKRRTGSGFG